MEENFVKADSGNLPKVDAIMIGLFFKNNPDFYGAELRNVKTTMSGRESYGDDAVGYVQLRRESGMCTLKCKMCPEHKVRASSYNVTMIVDENKGEVIKCQCLDCPASAGGCKHAVAFLMWTHRRSEQPSCTDVECYWRKSSLSRVGSTTKFITVEQLSKKRTEPVATSETLYEEYIQEAKKKKISTCELLRYKTECILEYDDLRRFSLHNFIFSSSDEIKNSASKMIEKLIQQLDDKTIILIEEQTRNQHKSPLWYEMRYGRITASKAHEVSRCQTPEGMLVATIMGATTPDTAAMKRGRQLEKSVIKTVQTKIKRKIKQCGLFLSSQYPMVAASPDGICADGVIEVKCPTSEKTRSNYIKNDKISEKCCAQVMLQMHITKKNKAYFCVAHPDYEISKKVDIYVVEYDSDYVNDLLENVASFWKLNIYPLLVRSVKI